MARKMRIILERRAAKMDGEKGEGVKCVWIPAWRFRARCTALCGCTVDERCCTCIDYFTKDEVLGLAGG